MNIIDQVRTRFALAMTRQSMPTECPPLEAVQAWHEKSLDTQRAAQVQRHVAHCDHCYALWSGLVELQPEPQDKPMAQPASRPWWHFAAPAMAMGAAAVTLWLGIASVPPFMAYDLSVQGGMDLRGNVDAPITLTADTLLEIVLLPQTATSETVASAVYARTRESLSLLAVPMDVSDKGVVAVEGLVGDEIAIPAGVTHLVIVVGREGRLPSADELRRELNDAEQASARHWRAWSVPVAP